MTHVWYRLADIRAGVARWRPAQVLDPTPRSGDRLLLMPRYTDTDPERLVIQQPVLALPGRNEGCWTDQPPDELQAALDRRKAARALEGP